MLHVVLRRRPRSSCLLQQTIVRGTRRCPNPPPNIYIITSPASTLTRTPGGLSMLRTESAAATVPAILAEAEAAWQQQQKDITATMRVLLLHDELEDDVEAMESNVPTVGATAERNQLLDTDMVTGAKEGDEKEAGEAAKAKAKSELPSPLDDPTTATCISVGVPNVEEIVLFHSHDASFPTLRRKGNASATDATDVSSSLATMITQKQPKVLLLFAEPQFPLAELSSRLESIFDKSHVMAAYARAVLPALRPPRILALGGGDTPAPADDESSSSSSSGSGTPQAVGLALFGESALSTEDVGRLACSLFGSSWLGNFSLDERLTRHLFVPSNIVLGKQPPCSKYQALEETHAHNLPLFRLHSVLFPGCSLMLKIFEPRYRRMVKRALERNEPFGLLNADASVGTLASITEVYRMEEDTGISILKITGTRRFEVQASHVADDSFGLLHATTAKFFEEDPVEDLEELESLRVQARACLASSLAAASASAMGPPPPSFLLQTGQQQQGEEGREEGREAAVVLAEESFVLSQWLVDSYQSVMPERKKMEWLRTTSTTTRMRDCLDLLLSVVRRGRGGGVGKGGGTAL